MWTKYQVRWEFLTWLYGSLPNDPDLVTPMLSARRPKTRPPESRGIDETAEAIIATLPDQEDTEIKKLVFARKHDALCMGAHTIRAHLKDCARILSRLYVGKLEGEQSFAWRVQDALYWPVEQEYVPILDATGQPFTKPTGEHQRPGHPRGPMGTQSTIKIMEYIEGAHMEFILLVLTPPDREVLVGRGKEREKKFVPSAPAVSERDLNTLMLYGATHGYGGERSLNGGRYAFTILRLAD